MNAGAKRNAEGTYYLGSRFGLIDGAANTEGYVYDAIGSRKTTQREGMATTWVPDWLNRYGSRRVTNYTQAARGHLRCGGCGGGGDRQSRLEQRAPDPAAGGAFLERSGTRDAREQSAVEHGDGAGAKAGQSAAADLLDGARVLPAGDGELRPR